MAQFAHDVTAEQALLGAAILASNDTMPAFLSVPEFAYYMPKHQVIAGVIRDMIVNRKPVDAVTILAAIEEAGLSMRVGGGPYLHTLVSRPWVAVHAEAYAARVLELFGRRRLWEELTRESQRLDADWDSGECGRPIDASIGNLRAVCDELMGYSAGAAIQEPRSLTDLLGERDTYDWLVPGLLERGDRIILTGEEGFGKSELVGQIALAIAGGVHPFMGEVLEGVEPRVLIVDCENSVGQTRRRYRRIAGAVDSTRATYQAPELDWNKRVRVEFRTSGLDLLKGSDVAYLEALVAACSPDLLVIGPLYKLHTTNINDGEAARKMLDVLDRLRERHGFALLTEAHPNKGERNDGSRRMAPEGSSLFMRWPEFGFGLRRSKDDPQNQADVISWRGQREERDWPSGFVRGYNGLLPWRPTPDYYDRPDPAWQG
jgi:replicative DNA helicase